MKIKNKSDKPKVFKLGKEMETVQPGKISKGEIAIVISEPDTEMIDESKKEEEVKESEEPKVELLSKDELKKKTKDELNDYGAKIGIDEISTSMKKDTMVNKIVKFIKKLVK